MSKYRKVQLAILIGALIVIAIDIALVIADFPTISKVVAKWAYYNSTVPLFLGVLMGHFFFNWKPPWKKVTQWIAMVGLVTYGSLDAWTDIPLLDGLMPAFVLILGIMAGMLLWPQSPKESR